MKSRFGLIIVGALVFGASQLTFAQCPEICDASEKTGLGSNALSSTIGTDTRDFFALGRKAESWHLTSANGQALKSWPVPGLPVVTGIRYCKRKLVRRHHGNGAAGGDE